MEARKRFGITKAKLYFTAAFILICFLLLIFLRPSAPVKQDKATWLWDAVMIRSEAEKIVEFSRREGVNTIFLQIQESVPANDYRRFIRLAHEADIAVHALGGEPEWAYTEQYSEGMKLLSWLEKYNMESKPEERFQGVQLDVEPYVLGRWEREQEEVVTEWSENMESWVKQARHQGLEVSAAIPFWLDSIPAPDGSGSFGYWMQELTDAVAVMSYRDDGEKMYELSLEELEQADKLGKSVWIGMELTDTPEGDYLTFYGKSEEVMHNEAHRAAVLGTEHPSFAGLAVHHYEEWYRKITTM